MILINNNQKKPPSGLILLDKKPGLTSFEALKEIKKNIGSGKAGHTGTLDKFASGLLLVLTGKALKLSPWFTHCDKQYIGTIQFGFETDTLDPEGAVTGRAPIPLQEDVEAALPRFLGTIQQKPPVYSAIHINGKRASALARSGVTPEMQERQVQIYRLELLEFQSPYARIFVHCSSGTYIRCLARDIALAVESKAHLTELTRIQIAGFRLADAGMQTPIAIDKQVFNSLGLPWFEVEKNDVQYIIHGKPLSYLLDDRKLVYQGGNYQNNKISNSFQKNQPAGIFCGDSFIAMAEKHNENWKYAAVFEESQKEKEIYAN